MSLPTVDEGLGFITYDDVATNSALLSKQQSDLSGNVTQRQFCIDAFHLAGNRDVSNALIVSDDITTETDNVLAFIGSNVKSVQRTYLSNINISTKNQLFAINAYDMTYGISKLNPLNSKFLVAPLFRQLTEKKLVASDRQATDFFGTSVAISGDYAIIGKPYDNNQRGAAYIFERVDGSWNQIKLQAINRFEGDQFGRSVAISGNYAVIGAYNFTNYKGEAYFFERENGTWTQKTKLAASYPSSLGSLFGTSVAISGNYAIVGAGGESSDASGGSAVGSAGAAHIFERTNGSWGEVQKIVAGDRQADDNFGISVSIDGNYAIVGAYGEDQDASDLDYRSAAGSAYIFGRVDGSWNQLQKIVANDRQQGDSFGGSVAISENYAIIGASNEDHDASGNSSSSSSDLDYRSAAGSAYIFEIDTDGSWNQLQKIVASDREDGDYFGIRVAISGSYAIVGANWKDFDNTNEAGAAYIFEG